MIPSIDPSMIKTREEAKRNKYVCISNPTRFCGYDSKNDVDLVYLKNAINQLKQIPHCIVLNYNSVYEIWREPYKMRTCK